MLDNTRNNPPLVINRKNILIETRLEKIKENINLIEIVTEIIKVFEILERLVYILE